jgi:hypothetical protein
MNFRAPFSKQPWIGSTVPDVHNELSNVAGVDTVLADPIVARAIASASSGSEHIEEQFGAWEVYEFDEMNLRSNARATIPQWASMGYWRNNQFGLLYALQIRCRKPWCRVQTLCRPAPGGWQFLLTLHLKHCPKIAIAFIAPSKTKAKQAVAERAIASAQLGLWLRQYHNDTMCDDYLKVRKFLQSCLNVHVDQQTIRCKTMRVILTATLAMEKKQTSAKEPKLMHNCKIASS